MTGPDQPYPRPRDMAQLQQVVLERLEVAHQKQVSPGLLDAAWEVEPVIDHVGRALTVALRGWVLTHHLADHTATATKRDTVTRQVVLTRRVQYRVPATWREARRNEWCQAAGWAVRWWARRRPVRWEYRTIEYRATVDVTHHLDVTMTVRWDQYVAFPESTYRVPPGLGRPVLWETQQPPDWRY